MPNANDPKQQDFQDISKKGKVVAKLEHMLCHGMRVWFDGASQEESSQNEDRQRRDGWEVKVEEDCHVSMSTPRSYSIISR